MAVSSFNSIVLSKKVTDKTSLEQGKNQFYYCYMVFRIFYIIGAQVNFSASGSRFLIAVIFCFRILVKYYSITC